MGAIVGAQLQTPGYTGRAKLVVDEDRRVLLGATFVGPMTVDLLHGATVAVTGELTLDLLCTKQPDAPGPEANLGRA